jgi:hypothetical protein
MKIIKEFTPSEYYYDNAFGKESTCTINVENNVIVVDFQKIINTQFSGGNVSNKYEDLKSFLNLGLFSSALMEDLLTSSNRKSIFCELHYIFWNQ